MPLHSTFAVNTAYGGAAPGVTRFRMQIGTGLAPSTAQVNLAAALIRTAYTGIIAQTPASIVYSWNPIVDVADDATGTITSTVTITSVPATLTGTDSGNYASGVGARARFFTGVRFRSRAVVGGAMAVPLAGGAFGTNGNLTATALTALNAWATYLAATLSADAVPLVVWSRPKPARGIYPVANGFCSLITSGTVDTEPAVLRRRRS